MYEECTEFSSSPALFWVLYRVVNKRSDVSEKSTSSVFRETKSGSRKPDSNYEGRDIYYTVRKPIRRPRADQQQPWRTENLEQTDFLVITLLFEQTFFNFG
jgi:hypothetical protein